MPRLPHVPTPKQVRESRLTGHFGSGPILPNKWGVLVEKLGLKGRVAPGLDQTATAMMREVPCAGSSDLATTTRLRPCCLAA